MPGKDRDKKNISKAGLSCTVQLACYSFGGGKSAHKVQYITIHALKDFPQVTMLHNFYPAPFQCVWDGEIFSFVAPIHDLSRCGGCIFNT